ncbi:MAG TPA: prepilin-type N-terminal cleavage/methylation domain-containing protein [Gammaproteobacteria bacterium]|jgi:prepilin-type N-terminal cleavage/methylation domain-containing protein|nr:prepilin-type N-terminal cleavage/methylation domain-containing protein [Gammaproteobacteria bacterium]
MQKASGFTLLEVLISLALLSIAILGMDGLQWRVLQNMRYQTYAVKAQQLALGLAARQGIHPAAVLSDNTRKAVSACLPQGRFEVQAKRVIVAFGGLAPSACTQSIIGRAGCVIVAT